METDRAVIQPIISLNFTEMHIYCEYSLQVFSEPVNHGFHGSPRMTKIVFHPCSSVPSVVKIQCFSVRCGWVLR